MKNKVYITIVSIVLILMQMTVLEYVKISNVKPNLMLVLIVILGFLGSKDSDLFFGGILCGVLQDVLSSKIIGIYLMINILFCVAISYIKTRIYRQGFMVFATGCFFASLLYEGLVWIVCAFPTTLGQIVFVSKNLLLKGAIYNTVCAIIVFLIAKKKQII